MRLKTKPVAHKMHWQSDENRTNPGLVGVERVGLGLEDSDSHEPGRLAGLFKPFP